MARLARVVIRGMPHDNTQRVNRRQQTLFHNEDYAAYVELMARRVSSSVPSSWSAGSKLE